MWGSAHTLSKELNWCDLILSPYDSILDCHQPPFGWITNNCLYRAIVDDVTIPKYGVLSLIILSHIVLAKFARTSREICWSLLPFHANHLASFLHWQIKSKQNFPCSNRSLAQESGSIIFFLTFMWVTDVGQIIGVVDWSLWGPVLSPTAF
jgi:hypothetical protein